MPGNSTTLKDCSYHCFYPSFALSLVSHISAIDLPSAACGYAKVIYYASLVVPTIFMIDMTGTRNVHKMLKLDDMRCRDRPAMCRNIRDQYQLSGMAIFVIFVDCEFKVNITGDWMSNV